MSKFVTEINQFLGTPEQKKLAKDLRAVVLEQQVTEHLLQRHLLGVLERHGDASADGEQKSQSSIFAAYKKHNNRELGVFVLTGHAGNTLGLATVDPTPRLRKLTLPVVPPRFVPKRWQHDKGSIASAGPEVCAWVAPGEGLEGGTVLTEAYKLLMRPDGPAQKFYEQHAKLHPGASLSNSQPWTIEPLESRSWVHSAIRSSGVAAMPERGYYDDGESLRVSPPTSILYIASTALHSPAVA